MSIYANLFDDGPSTYAWVITADLTATPEDGPPGTNMNAVGVAGPSDAPFDLLEAVKVGKGRAFRIYDDDGNLYYRGRFANASGELDDDAFGPLSDYGAPNAGATEIHYLYNVPGLEGYEDKKWRAL